VKAQRPVEARRARAPAATGGLKRRTEPELTAARVLCRALRRKRERAEKKRIVHLICLNLLAILERRARRP